MLTIQSFILSSFLSLLHPFYVSIIDVNHNTKDKNVEISVRIFVDDFETTLNKNSKKSIDITKSVDNVEVNKLVQNYVQSKLQMYIDGKFHPFQYVGFEIQKESVWIYFEVPNITSIKKIHFNCTLLYDFQEKQMNIFNVKANGTEKNYKLDYPKSTVDFSW